MFKQFFKRMQEVKRTYLIEEFVQEEQSLPLINEWSRVGFMIARLFADMPEKPDKEKYKATYAFEKNDMKYEIETTWQEANCELFLYGYIEGTKTKIATFNKVFDHRKCSLIFNLPLERKGKEKIKEMIIKLKEELNWQLNPEERPKEKIEEPLTKQEEKEALKKARVLESYL